MVCFETKSFNELTLEDLYRILRLRSEVFVVEQDCVYQDIDNKDQYALHVIGRKDKKIIAYTRIFDKGDYFTESSIGRVVVDSDYRKHKIGKDLMLYSIKSVSQNFGETPIRISAQCYLEKFYKELGFIPEGESYLEDGIPHISMIKVAT